MAEDGVQWKEVQWPEASSYSFVELPSGTQFVESCSHNVAFDKDHVYVPAQMADKNSLAIFRVDVSGRSPAEVYMHFKEGNTQGASLYPTLANHDVLDDTLASEALPFGSALSNDGILYVCIFNKNMVVMIDLKGRRVLRKVEVPAPNDVCIDANDPWVSYVACGVWVEGLGELGVMSGGHLSMTLPSSKKWRTVNPTEGSVRRIRIAENDQVSTEVVAKGTKALAGVGVSQGKLWLAMLVNIDAVPLTSLAPSLRPDKKEFQVWSGYDEKLAYLADNVATYDESHIIVPCYRSLWRLLAKLSENGCFAYLGFLGAKACSGCIKLQKSSATADEVFSAEDYPVDLTDPSVAPELHEGGVFPHIHIVIVNTASKKSSNTSIMLPKAMVDKGGAADFDGHVTHVEHVNNKLVCVNFLKMRLLILSDSVLGGNVP
mmetsp:Transcript_12324/g.30189  ORF Transcript_12324/g.30189 Transcript_12324/m.30189 type:complete len:432 (+) Transcript_12324:227-1522(+)|eukprot:CAMPEP_0206279740 /NCGR_PEP_ID=MMETSP0047_2-20121206/38178_1 /ASSEMBLY_ACC=CAM_ASM_000192 /TAXON_ID=195065 /ORGANISM="Chroomonas mesostigmatica_cf, Strain CCMP1168" /LENGTH=431 /DNA_ID=CAMNT_0053709699 /DNA_START=183 /DNA_END=1478 /DNA_ORIENTATION=-